jgi:hypothetical protein
MSIIVNPKINMPLVTAGPKSNLDKNFLSDKLYWHGYIPFYETFFSIRDIKNIAEFGVYKGNSIRWLLERFPSSEIYGADILPLQPTWPKSENFHFTQLDQGDPKQVKSFLQQQTFNLIIEDGSHLVQHQINCLIEGMENLAPNGIYILEDIQTARSDHAWWGRPKLHWWKFKERKAAKKLVKSQHFERGNALNLLLALDHYQRINIKIDEEVVKLLSINSLFSKEQIINLASHIKSIHLYQRSHLPDMCHHCGSINFDFINLRCRCGEKVFSDSDSMSFVIIKN